MKARCARCFAGYARVRRALARRARGLVDRRAHRARFASPITRITDFAMRPRLGERVMKDYRRFWARHERLVELGDALARWFA